MLCPKRRVLSRKLKVLFFDIFYPKNDTCFSKNQAGCRTCSGGGRAGAARAGKNPTARWARPLEHSTPIVPGVSAGSIGAVLRGREAVLFYWTKQPTCAWDI